MRVTVSSSLLVTHTPFSPTAMPAGPSPTWMSCWVPSRMSTRVTRLRRRAMTHTPPRPTARSWTPAGSRMSRTTERVRGSMRRTKPGLPRIPTQIAFSPAATPTTLPPAGSGISLPTRRRVSRSIETSAGSRWRATQSLPKPAAAAAGSAPTRGLSSRRAARLRIEHGDPVVAAAQHPHAAAGDDDLVGPPADLGRLRHGARRLRRPVAGGAGRGRPGAGRRCRRRPRRRRTRATTASTTTGTSAAAHAHRGRERAPGGRRAAGPRRSAPGASAPGRPRRRSPARRRARPRRRATTRSGPPERPLAGGGERRAAEVAGRREAVGGVLGQRAAHDVVQRPGHARRMLGERGRRVVEVRPQRRLVAVALVRRDRRSAPGTRTQPSA